MKTMKKILSVILILAMLLIMVNPATADAATKVKLNKKKITLTITDNKKNPTATLKMKGTTKKAKWSTSDKTIATVKKGKVTAKAAGKVTITAKVNGKKCTCKVTVKDKRTVNDTGTLNVTVKSVTTDIREHGVNASDNRVIVTYNGKDVTKKAEYELREVGNENVAYILENGVIIEAGTFDFYDGNYKLTVTYNGMKKTVKLKAKTTQMKYYECYCGAKFDNIDDWSKHDKANALEAIYNGTVDKCGGCYYVPYYLTEIVLVGT